MTAYSREHGHKVYLSPTGWRYLDTDEAIGKPRPCKECEMTPEPDGPDPCLGMLPGVEFACCGHGDPSQAYVAFTDGTVIRGFNKVEKEQ